MLVLFRGETICVNYKPFAKSSHHGFILSINIIFFSLLRFFITFSYSIASVIVGNSWYHTNKCTLYFLVNHSNTQFLCSKILFSRFEVTHTYNVPFFIEAKIYVYHFFMFIFILYKTCFIVISNVSERSIGVMCSGFLSPHSFHSESFEMTVFLLSSRTEVGDP